MPKITGDPVLPRELNHNKLAHKKAKEAPQ